MESEVPPIMQDPILRTDSLAVGYDSAPVVSDILLTALPGQVVALIGPNGVGKSTVLKTLLRQLAPLDGAVVLAGRDLRAYDPRALARTTSAVLTGRPEPELMTCREVAAAGRHPYTGRLGILSRRDRERVEEAMALVGVSDLADRDFNRLSDGQRQRVLLARAICQEPRLLVLDEPTSFLDIRHKLDFLALLRRLARERRLAVLLSLHELELAQKCADRVVCLKDGRIHRAGPPEEIFTAGYIETLYDLDRGRYDPRFGSLEPEPVPGPPQVFVIGGGGRGIPVYRQLHRRGIPFAAGVLPGSDLDLPVAEALAAELVTDAPMEPVSDGAVDRALEIAAGCRALICCPERFGTVDRANERLAAFAGERGMLRTPAQLEEI